MSNLWPPKSPSTPHTKNSTYFCVYSTEPLRLSFKNKTDDDQFNGLNDAKIAEIGNFDLI